MNDSLFDLVNISAKCFSCIVFFIYVCLSVALIKATYSENVQIVLSCPN